MSAGNVTMLVENSTLEQEVADTVIFWIEAVITPGISIGGLLGRQVVVEVVVGEWGGVSGVEYDEGGAGGGVGPCFGWWWSLGWLILMVLPTCWRC